MTLIKPNVDSRVWIPGGISFPYHHAMPKPVLPPSKQFRSRHIEFFDFIFPAMAGLWNLRWQATGYIAVKPDATATELSERFVFGSGLKFRNIRSLVVDREWETQQEQFAKMILVNVLSMFEGWVEELTALFPRPVDAKVALQFPSAGITQRTKPGIREAIVWMTTNKSSHAESILAQPAKQDRRYAMPHLEEMMIMYRYFKEVRNSLSHANGVVSAYQVAAYTDAASTSHMGLNVNLAKQIQPLEAGKPCAATLQTVLSFSELVLRIVTTVDAVLAGTFEAESIFLDRWKSTYGLGPMAGLPEDPARRIRKLQGRVVELGYSKPDNLAELRALLDREGLFT